MAGFKQDKAPKTKDKFHEVEVNLQNLQMAGQMSQMMIKHLSQELSVAKKDLASAMGMINDFQYRTLAMLELGNFDKVLLESKAEELKLKDFSSASDKEDLEMGNVNNDSGVVDENSIALITSNTPDEEEDRGIFRSKFAMRECQTETLRAKFLGAKVGDSFEEVIGTVKHVITILGIRQPKELEVKEE